MPEGRELTAEPSTLAYATPDRPTPRGPKVWAAALTLFAGLLLVGLGGCFLIGVMVATGVPFLSGMKMMPLESSQIILVAVLYVFAFACLAGAAIVVVVALRWFWIVMRA